VDEFKLEKNGARVGVDKLCLDLSVCVKLAFLDRSNSAAWEVMG
jgi:hypothetical protein